MNILGADGAENQDYQLETENYRYDQLLKLWSYVVIQIDK